MEVFFISPTISADGQTPNRIYTPFRDLSPKHHYIDLDLSTVWTLEITQLCPNRYTNPPTAGSAVIVENIICFTTLNAFAAIIKNALLVLQRLSSSRGRREWKIGLFLDVNTSHSGGLVGLLLHDRVRCDTNIADKDFEMATKIKETSSHEKSGQDL
ncbi:uncharacterized protein Z518_00215 [Rhinocladiella mackenziei CBS 650.93]|uniref:Uncharacterized protein n=1 Tax=Rhinocladiella mackenziei CBS 650.93 TaxID=1442369 RepID=A0A0D2G3I1_9EURO|nr:uncharacterized protein Z518_00215 [Rhinocladiella mackenziei CBS 650.93]KIX09137.1 hypothetical protein Z518_00215 [Rhinocladiella mackenziei CBS 650.93]